MNKEKQRIAIAKACGLFEIMPLRRTTRKGKESPNGVKLWYAESHMGGAAEYREVPRYPDDLNAMQEAEKMLTPLQWSYYLDFLTDPYAPDWQAAVHATAAQRAVAFLKTLNLWEEE